MAVNENEILKKLNEVIELNEKLRSENEKQKNEIESLKTNNTGDFKVDIGCNALMGATLESASGDINIEIRYGEIVTLDSSDIRSLVKNNEIRKMFINCLIYFVDVKNYKKFGINNRVNLSDSKIIDIIGTNDENKILKYFNECTNNKSELSVVHTLFYKIIILNSENKFGNLSFEIRERIEKYFNMEIKMATTLYKSMKSKGFI